ncbi:hypothetical protein C8R44DRAFT_853366 [Mycena epipterygia]|nr:hypothetical protein C8R44DRAFT_853366 [Mycena epipterygia]
MLKKIIHLHNIQLKSEPDQHKDLPLDMQMSAQLIIDGNIFLQTIPVGSEQFQNSWKLRLDCNVPLSGPTFSVAILCISETQGTRLLGSVEIGRSKALASVEQKSDFQTRLKKVNPDGPSIEFSADFTISGSTKEPFGWDGIDITQIQIDKLDSSIIVARLESLMDDATSGMNSPTEFLDISVMHESILLLSSTNKSRARFLNMLGDVCFESYEKGQGINNLNQAVCAYGDAMRDNPEDAKYCGDLGVAFKHRFEQLGDLSDINKSLITLQRAVNLSSDNDPNKVVFLNNFGNSLCCRFQRLGDLGDISKSVLVFQQALKLTPDGKPGKNLYLQNLGNSLLCRFMQLGDLNDMNESVMMLQQAVALTPDNDPRKSRQYTSIGSALLSCFQRLGNLVDLNESVTMHQQACRFEHLGDLGDINKSVLMFQQAVKLTPNNHPNKPMFFNSLGDSLWCRFKQLGDLSDLNKSVMLLQQAVDLTPEDHSSKCRRLTNLGKSLVARFEHLGNISDINKSVLIFQQAVQLTPEDNPNKPVWFTCLGNSLLSRFE